MLHALLLISLFVRYVQSQDDRTMREFDVVSPTHFYPKIAGNTKTKITTCGLSSEKVQGYACLPQCVYYFIWSSFVTEIVIYIVFICWNLDNK